MNASLLAALRVVARADADPTRTLLFDRLAARRPSVRLARSATQGALRGRLPAVLAVAGYGLVSARICLSPPAAPIWALPLFDNDRRQIDRVAACVGPARVGRSGTGLRLAAPLARVLVRALAGGHAWRFLRAVRRLCRRHDFLVSCRTASALACAMLAGDALRGSPVRAVLVSSDYNAEAVGLLHAARRRGIATIHVAHAPTHHLSPPLEFSLAILDGEAALDAYRRKGPIRGRQVFKGVEGRERPLAPEALARPQPVIGIFLPKEVDWSAFRELVEDARRSLSPRRIVLRWHPNAMERPRLSSVLSDTAAVEARPTGTALDEDARECDFVVADRNSSVPLKALKAGVPALVVSGLAVFPSEHTDLYGLVADAVVPPPARTLSELRPASLASFYDASWPARFLRHDAAYQRPAEEVERRIREAVLDVIGERAEGT